MSLKTNRFIRGLLYGFKHTFLYKRSAFGFLDKDARFTPPCNIINPSNVYIYSGIGIGDATISAVNAKFIVKKGCAIANGLNVQTGNHVRVVGKFVNQISEDSKPEGYDKDVIVDEDVWIGSNVTILSGVHVCRGATIAAGAVVNTDVPPYSIVGGVPAKVLKYYWTKEQIIEHEKNLYSEEERLSEDVIDSLLNDR